MLDDERPQIDDVVATAVGFVLGASVAPDAFQRSAVDQSVDALESWPLSRTGHKILFRAVADQVSQALDLCGLLV